MGKTKKIFRTVKSALIIIFFRVYDRHFSSLADFESAGESVGENLQKSVSGAVDTAGKYYPEEYKNRLRDAVKRGFNK